MKQLIPRVTTSKRLVIFIQDTSSTSGAGKTGLAFNSSGLTWYYWREDTGNAGGTSVTLATATRGTFTSGGFIEIDATNLPGFYEIGIPDNALAAGASWCVMQLKGVTGMAPVSIEIELVDGITRNRAFAGFSFPMLDGGNGLVTGETITATRSIDGGSFASCSNSASEIGTTGVYKIDLSAADLNGRTVCLKFTSTNAKPAIFTLVLQN